jgi:hypothetical protein
VSVADGFRFGVGFTLASAVMALLLVPIIFVFGMERDVGEYVDPMTGCHYITPLFNHGFTPRLDADGNHICIEPDHDQT